MFCCAVVVCCCHVHFISPIATMVGRPPKAGTAAAEKTVFYEQLKNVSCEYDRWVVDFVFIEND